MSEQNDSEPTFKKPDGREKHSADDPHADMRNYFAYWEARRLIDEQNRRREWDSLSVYERARRKYEG
jgi:hypothetical protein